MENLQSMKTKGQEVSETFKTIIKKSIFSDYDPIDVDSNYERMPSYKPSPVETKYLADYVMQRTRAKFLNLKKIKLTEETGSLLGKLLSSSQINKIFIDIRSNGELALIREMQQIKEYYFSGSSMRHWRTKSLVSSLNNFLTEINFSGSLIDDDNLKIILRVLKNKITEMKTYNYTLTWDQHTNLNDLELEELFECAECQKLTVENFMADGINEIKINNILSANSFLHIKVNHTLIEIREIKEFLNLNNKKNFVVKVNEGFEGCPLLISMIDIMKDLPMEFDIHCFLETISEEVIDEIMKDLIKTNLNDLKLEIVEEITSDEYHRLFDKLKNMKFQRLFIGYMKLINFDSQAIVKPLEIPGLACLCIHDCKLDYNSSKALVCKLGNSNLDKFSVSRFYFNTELVYLLSQSLIWSNLVDLEITNCDLDAKQIEIIAEALKDTKITSIDLTRNKIKKAGVKAIANVVDKTKLNTLILNGNDFHESDAVELLKSVQKTKIVSCCMFYCDNIKGSLDGIANVLKNNKILLNCIEKGRNNKIDEYIKRNRDSLKKAKLTIDKYQKGTILYEYKYKKYFEAYESFINTDTLWNNINDKQKIRLNLGNKINDNYMQICGIINKKLEANNEHALKQINFSNFSLETLNKICSYLNISDVVS